MSSYKLHYLFFILIFDKSKRWQSESVHCFGYWILSLSLSQPRPLTQWRLLKSRERLPKAQISYEFQIIFKMSRNQINIKEVSVIWKQSRYSYRLVLYRSVSVSCIFTDWNMQMITAPKGTHCREPLCLSEMRDA